MKKHRYILIVQSRDDRGREDEWFLVIKEPDGWVSATSTRWNGDNKHITESVKTFSSREAAERFAKKWKGHPSWCNPTGKYEIVAVEPVYVEVLDHYRKTHEAL